jgi:cupin 2 domain-containing protein
MNLFADVPPELAGEENEMLLESSVVRIERIVSRGQASPPGFWYDQPHHEWVAVLRGAARLCFEDRVLAMKAGDSVHIPAHARHRVDWTTPDEPTIWLAVHFS